jgi:translation initiation factor 2 subunit 1
MFSSYASNISEPDVFGDLGLNELQLKELQTNVARRLTPQPVKIRADIEVTNFSYSGIDAIRSALIAGEKLSTESIPIKIRLVAPPLYVMVSNATDKQGAIERLERAIEVISDSVKKEGGDCTVKMKPKAVSETDDLELQALLDRVARENQEVEGEIRFFEDWIEG